MDFREVIMEELSKRIFEAQNTDNIEAVFELENFMDWFMETFIL